MNTPGMIGMVIPIERQLLTKFKKVSELKQTCVIIKLAPASTCKLIIDLLKIFQNK